MYTSGRTVKSRFATPSPVVLATRTGRRLATRHLPKWAAPMVKSETVSGQDGVRRVRTEIVFADMPEATSKPLADAIESLPGYHSMAWNILSITYLIDMEG